MRLPDGWRQVRLADVAETALGKMLDAAWPRGASRVRDLPNLNVQWGRIELDDVQEVFLSEEENRVLRSSPATCSSVRAARSAGPRFGAVAAATWGTRRRCTGSGAAATSIWPSSATCWSITPTLVSYASGQRGRPSCISRRGSFVSCRSHCPRSRSSGASSRSLKTTSPTSTRPRPTSGWDSTTCID